MLVSKTLRSSQKGKNTFNLKPLRILHSGTLRTETTLWHTSCENKDVSLMDQTTLVVESTSRTSLTFTSRYTRIRNATKSLNFLSRLAAWR